MAVPEQVVKRFEKYKNGDPGQYLENLKNKHFSHHYCENKLAEG